MDEYKVGDKVRILDVKAIDCGAGRWKTGDVVEVVAMSAGKPQLARYKGDSIGLVISRHEFHAIELVEESPKFTKKARIETPKLTKKARIEALERRVAELERQPTPSNTITSVYDVKLGDKIAIDGFLSAHLRGNSSYEVVELRSENSAYGEKIVVLNDVGGSYNISQVDFAKLRKVAS